MRNITMAAVIALAAGAAGAQETMTPNAVARLSDREGNDVGSASFYETASGMMYVVVQATGIEEGIHGVHVHETGDCSADDFSSAGGHLAGDAQHGVLVEGGPHPGDLPNAHVQNDGVLAMETFNAELTMDMMMDEDGSAFIIHAGADDYVSQPAGNSGDRVACGVIEAG
jgi:Cu-Zn family superoxide dismutase